VHVDAARLQIGRSLDFIDMEGDVAIDMSGRGTGLDAAAYWERPGLSIGLAYRGGTRIDLDGGANFTAPDAFANKVPDQDARSRLALPDQLVVGARVQVAKSYTALADVEYSRWSTNDKLVVDFAEMQTPDVTQVTAWRDTVALRAGGEWTRGRLVVRHGGYLEQSPAPPDRLAPSSPDSTRLGLTAGASWRFDRTLAVDAFIEAMWLLRRDTADAESLQASYGGTATLAGLGIRWTP
jgi:long-subunit fatty acid transport protein